MTASSDGAPVAAMECLSKKMAGVQYHPESVLTQYGHRMLVNWLRLAGGEYSEELLAELEEQQAVYQRAFSDVLAH